MKLCRVVGSVLVLVVGFVSARAVAAGNERPAEQLIPRDVLFGNPDHAQARISHDGKYISFLAPGDGVLNVWVAPVDNISAARQVTHDTKRGIRQYGWAYTNQHILYSQDDGGNERWNIHAVDVNTGEDRNLTPNPAVTARISQSSEFYPDEILVSINDRSPMFHDLHRINVRTGADQLVMENPGNLEGGMVAGLATDDQFNLRFVQVILPDGSAKVLKAPEPIALAAPKEPAAHVKWEEFAQIPMEDVQTTSIVGFDKSGEVAYVTDSRDRDTSALFAWNLKTNEKTLIAEDPKADIGDTLLQPDSRKVQAVAFNYLRKDWKILDPSIQADFDYLRSVAPGDITIGSRSLDDKTWTVAFVLDNGPARLYRYDRANKKAHFLFTNKANLEGQPLARMHPVEIPTRDGLTLVCYYTVPLSADSDQDGKPDRPVPMVLDVHGGPWARDVWGYHPEHQWLSNRGYAVMSVNYRGSSGFGKKFLNAGNKEWGGKMHDDLIDVVDWAVKNKVADPGKVAIMGGSYGGYATLVGMTFTPETFACGVDIVGPSSLYTLIKSAPPYWKPAIAMWRNRLGDESTAEGRAFLESRSPLSRVDQIKRPLLIGQGANDPRVTQEQADMIVKAMQEKNIPVTYVLYPDEGHGFARPANRISFYAVVEAFLAEHLGGRFEAIGSDFEGSSIEVKAGADQIPGLKEAVPTTRPTKSAGAS